MAIVLRPVTNVYVPLPLQYINPVRFFLFEAYDSSFMKSKHDMQNNRIYVYAYLVIT